MSNLIMKKFYILPLIAALGFFVSCQKEQAVERPVQTAEEKQRSEARQKQALAEKAAANAPAVSTVTPVTSPVP